MYCFIFIRNYKFIPKMIQQLLDKFLSPQTVKIKSFDLGPPIFKIRQTLYKRTEHLVKNVPFSYYQHPDNTSTIVYIHSYNSTRLQAKSMLESALTQKFNIIAVELQRFHNSQSKNGIITFGHTQFKQLIPIIQWIKNKQIGQVILWGRSMGAVCALKYQYFYNGADKLVLDSIFHDLQQLFVAKANEVTKIPKLLAILLIKLYKNTINEKLTFNMQDLNMQKFIDIKCPIYFLCNKQDPISGQATQILYDQFQGKKKIFYTKVDHSEQREQYLLKQIVKNLISKSSPKLKAIKKPQMKSLSCKQIHEDSFCSMQQLRPSKKPLQKQDLSDCKTQMVKTSRTFLRNSCY